MTLWRLLLVTLANLHAWLPTQLQNCWVVNISLQILRDRCWRSLVWAARRITVSHQNYIAESFPTTKRITENMTTICWVSLYQFCAKHWYYKDCDPIRKRPLSISEDQPNLVFFTFTDFRWITTTLHSTRFRLNSTCIQHSNNSESNRSGDRLLCPVWSSCGFMIWNTWHYKELTVPVLSICQTKRVCIWLPANMSNEVL